MREKKKKTEKEQDNNKTAGLICTPRVSLKQV